LEPGAQRTPAALLATLATIHAELGGDATLLASKRLSRPKLDLFLGDAVVVEVDEIQHFSSARLRTLSHYDGLEVGFDVDLYRALCAEHARRADAYRRAKTATEFPFPGGRTAQRAYLDAARDLLGPANGWTVLRIAAPDGDHEAVVRDLLVAAARLWT
jgi:very-short-patch-repair endonuclease